LEVYRPFLTWLHRRSDVRAVFMIHDLIPLQLPQHHLRIGIRLHERIVKNTAEFAKAIIVPSQAVADSVGDALSSFGRGDMPIHVEHLAVGPEFLSPTSKDNDLANLNYFMICGAIDSYKNHLLLLKAWKRLSNRHGQETPKLLIAGSPGVTAEAVLTFIRNCPELESYVVFASGLSTRALRQLMIGAKALLMPSLAEGFGLPIIEALAQGTPVLASDIPAHREAGKGSQVIFLDANSEDEWLREIERLGDSRLSGAYAPKTWADYFQGLAAFFTSTDWTSADTK
jgi:glycosyltransferase involved in cell wall biosynthesis